MISTRYELTEGTLTSLRYATVEFNDMMRSSEYGVGRVRGHWPSLRSSRWKLESALVRYVTIVESYVDALSLHRLTTSPSIPSATKTNLDSIFKESTRSWSKRETAFRIHHSLDLASCKSFKEFKCATVVRNCIAHGLGKLTMMQIGDSSIVQDCATVDVHVGSGHVYVTESSLRKILKFSEEFVLDLDSRIPL